MTAGSVFRTVAASIPLLTLAFSPAHAQSGSMENMDMAGMDMGSHSRLATFPSRRMLHRTSGKISHSSAHATAVVSAKSRMDAMSGMEMRQEGHSGYSSSSSMNMGGMTMGAEHGMGGPDVLASTAPAAGQTLLGSPSALSLSFNQLIRMQSLQIFDSTGARVPIGAPTSQAVGSISTRLPVLPPDVYDVRWRALTADGQVAAGEIKFSVS